MKPLEVYRERAMNLTGDLIRKRTLDDLSANRKNCRDNMVSSLGVDGGLFYISCDEPKCARDVEIMDLVLGLDSKVVLVEQSYEMLSGLREKFHGRIVNFDTNVYTYIFSSDLHIYLNNHGQMLLLKRYNKCFNATCPDKYPASANGLATDGWTDDKLKFYFHENAGRIRSYDDLYHYLYRDTFSDDEINGIKNSFKIDRFLILLRYVINDKAKADHIAWIMKTGYLYDEMIKNNCKENDKVAIKAESADFAESFIKAITS